MAVKLRTKLRSAAETPLPAMLPLDHPTVAEPAEGLGMAA